MALYVRGAALSAQTWSRIGPFTPRRAPFNHPRSCSAFTTERHPLFVWVRSAKSHERAVRGIKNSKNELELVRPMDVAAVHVDYAVTVEKEPAVRHDSLQSCRHPARRIYLHRLRKLRSVCIWVRSAKSPALVVFLSSLQLHGGHRRSAHRRAGGHRRRDNALKLQ